MASATYDPMYPLFPVAAALGTVLVLIPLPWHLEAWNSGTCYYMIWTALACLNQFINSVVWANDAINRAPVWCDISTRITLASAVGIPAASLCIMRRLYLISRVQAVSMSHQEKRRAIIIDTLICVAFPLIELVLAYIVQGHRFDIFQEIGCRPHVYNTLLAYFLVSMWPIIIGLISAGYCCLILRSFVQRQAQFSEFASSNSFITVGRYLRLMALACVEILCTTPLAIFQMVVNLKFAPLEPWRSWADTHSNFSRVVLYPAVLWRSNPQAIVAFKLYQWIPVLCAGLFFLFFGFAPEARRHYRNVLITILTACHLKRKEGPPISTKSTSGLRKLTLPSIGSTPQSSLPVYSSPPPQYKTHDAPSSPTSPQGGFMPLASAGTTSEFSFRTDEKQQEPSSPGPFTCAASTSSSRASSKSFVDVPV